MRGSLLDVVIFPAANKANKFWSGACAPEKGADCTVPTVWSLLAAARQIKQGKGKGRGVGETESFMLLNWVCSTEKKIKGLKSEDSVFPWTICANRWNQSRWHIWLKPLEKHLNFSPSSTNCIRNSLLAFCFRKLSFFLSAKASLFQCCAVVPYPRAALP